MEWVTIHNFFSYEDEHAIYDSEIESYGVSPDVAHQTGIIHFLLILTSMGVEHPFSHLMR